MMNLLNRKHRLLAYIYDVNLLCKIIRTMNTRKIKTALDSSEEAGQEINAEKTKHMLVYL